MDDVVPSSWDLAACSKLYHRILAQVVELLILEWIRYCGIVVRLSFFLNLLLHLYVCIVVTDRRIWLGQGVLVWIWMTLQPTSRIRAIELRQSVGIRFKLSRDLDIWDVVVEVLLYGSAILLAIKLMHRLLSVLFSLWKLTSLVYGWVIPGTWLSALLSHNLLSSWASLCHQSIWN